MKFLTEGFFVMAGSVVEEKIRIGMFVHAPLNSAVDVTARIHSIELALQQGSTEDVVCLCLELEPEALKFWRGLGVRGETLQITTSGSD